MLVISIRTELPPSDSELKFKWGVTTPNVKNLTVSHEGCLWRLSTYAKRV